MTEPISDEDLADLRFWAEPIPGRSPDRDSKALGRKKLRSLLARLDAAEARADHYEAVTLAQEARIEAALARAVPNGWEVVRVDGIPYLTPDRIRPLTEGEASDA